MTLKTLKLMNTTTKRKGNSIMIKAIDIHCHLNHGVDSEAAESEENYCNLEFLQQERTRLNVSIFAIAGTFASVLTDKTVEKENEYLYSVAQEHQNLYQWIVVDPRNDETFRQAKRMLKSKKSLGIKIHPICHAYSIEEYGDKIFSFANDNGCVVLTHPLIDGWLNVVGSWEAVNKYPDMKLIVAHLGTKTGYYTSIIQEAKHQNIYTDTSGNASTKNNVIERAVEQIGSKKILFGTDTYSCAFQRGRIDYADISQKDKENILYKNALRLFPQLEMK